MMSNLEAASKTARKYYKIGGMRRYEVTDEQWERIKPVLSERNRTDRPRADDREVLNSILYVLRTGRRWKDMPREYGAHATV